VGISNGYLLFHFYFRFSIVCSELDSLTKATIMAPAASKKKSKRAAAAAAAAAGKVSDEGNGATAVYDDGEGAPVDASAVGLAVGGGDVTPKDTAADDIDGTPPRGGGGGDDDDDVEVPANEEAEVEGAKEALEANDEEGALEAEAEDEGEEEHEDANEANDDEEEEVDEDDGGHGAGGDDADDAEGEGGGGGGGDVDEEGDGAGQWEVIRFINSSTAAAAAAGGGGGQVEMCRSDGCTNRAVVAVAEVANPGDVWPMCEPHLLEDFGDWPVEEWDLGRVMSVADVTGDAVIQCNQCDLPAACLYRSKKDPTKRVRFCLDCRVSVTDGKNETATSQSTTSY